MHETSWSLGTLVGFPVLILLTLAIFVGGICLLRVAARDTYDPVLPRFAAIFLLILSVGMAITTAVGMYPYKAEYHQWRTMGGEVVKIDSRLLNGANQKFVVTFANGDQLGCNDTRCAAIEPGDTLWLSCKRTWQYAGTDGWDCNFVEAKRSRS